MRHCQSGRSEQKCCVTRSAQYMLFNPFTDSAKSGKKFHVVDHFFEPSHSSNSRGQTSLTSATTSPDPLNTNRPHSSRSSSRNSTGRLVRTGHWVVAGPGVLIKPLSSQKAKEALQSNSLHSIDTFQAELQEAAELFGSMDDNGSDAGSVDTTPRVDAPSNGNPGETILTRVPDSPGSHSHFGDFYWDTNGETNYHDWDTDYDLDDLFGNRSRGRLGRTQQDLNKYKQRIDASVEQQREYSDLMNQMQSKLAEYRRHIADLEGKLISQRGASIGQDPSLFPLNDSGFIGDTTNTYVGRTGGDTNSNFDVMIRLDEERRRNDDIRMQLENERQNNEQLQRELERLSREYEREIRDKERQYGAREKNLTQYLSDEQKKMLDLWVELQKVRKQFAELKMKTENDLESQRNEFNKMYRNIQGITRTLSDGNIHQTFYNGAGGGDGFGGTTYNHDSLLIETVRRLRDSNRPATGGLNLDLELLNQLRNSKNTDNADLENELMKKYEEAIERNIELESRGDENQRKVTDLEAELKRTKDKLSDAQSAIRKMHDLSINSDRSDSHKRARSLSPGSGTPIQPSEALRSLRNVLREKSNEIQQLERKLKASEKQCKEFVNKFETADEARRRLDKLLDDAKREVSQQQKLNDDNERQIRRLEDKIRGLESEKEAAEKARKYLEEELQRLQQLFQKSTNEDARKAREEAEEFANTMEEDYKNRIAELNRRIEQLLKDNAAIRGEIGPLKDKYRSLESDHSTALRKIEERDAQLQFADELKRKTLQDYDNIKNQMETLRNELDVLTNDNEALRKNAAVYEQNNKELKQQRDEFNKQRDEISRQLFDIRHKLETEKKQREDAEKKLQVLNDEIEKHKTQITDYERQLILVRRHNDELDTQIKNDQAKSSAQETEILSNRKEIEKLNELNQRLQREKQEILDAKHKTEATSHALKEQIRKLEKEVEKLQNENKVLEGKEERAREAHAQQVNRAHLLQKELEAAKREIKELQEKIEQLEKDFKDKLRGSLKSKSSSEGGRTLDQSGEGSGEGGTEGGGETGPSGGNERYYDREITEIRIKEVNDKWKLEVEKLENEKDQLEAKIRELEDQLNQIDRGNERQENEIADLKRKHQQEIDRLRQEISTLHDKHQNDMEDERETYQKNLDGLRLLEEELQEKLATTEKRLADALNLQNELEREKREYDDKVQALSTQNSKLRDDLEDARTQADQDIQKWKNDAYSARSELKTLETTINGLKTQLAAATDRNDTLNKTVNDHVAKIRDLNTQIRKLEEDLTEARSNLRAKDADLDSALNRLHQLDEQHASLSLEHTKTKNDLEALLREKDALDSNNTVLQNEVDRLKKRVNQLEETAKEQKTSLDMLKSERERLQNAFREKSKLADHLQQLSQQFDGKMGKLRRELQETSDKLISSDTERANLRTELARMQQELDFGKEQMLRKNDEYQSALQDLSQAHRASEDGRLNALQELETRKYELADLTSRLDSTEQRLNNLQQEYIRVDSERELLADALRRFQNTVNRVMALNRFKPTIDVDVMRPTHPDIDGTAGEDSGINPDQPQGSPLRSVPFPPGIEYGDTVHLLDETGGGALKDGIDVSNIENTLQHLISRIDRLQRDRDEYREELNRLKKKTSETHTTINKRETRYKTIEESLDQTEDEKRALEAHLASAKQLLRSQEETMRQREEERRQLKSKMVAADLQARGKEAQIRHLNEQLKNLRRDLDNAHEEIRSMRDKEESYDSSRFQIESKLRDHENELQRLHLQVTNYETEKQNNYEKIKELEGQLKLSEAKYNDYRDDIEKLRRDLLKAETVESDLRKSLEQQSRNNSEYQNIRDQLTRTQNELNNITSRKNQLDTEIIGLRSELRDYKQRVNEMNNRASDLQRQLQDAHLDKNRSDDRILELEKTITAHRTGESELQQQLELLKNEKKALSKEIGDLKQRLAMLEGEKGSLGRVHDQWKREKQLLLKKIEALETEKRRTDAAIRETALQREAIEKSLNAMERENRELYKNCAQLQQQIAQLEMENGNRIVELTNKQREEQERQLARIRNEKAQIERIIENRERTHRNRIKQLEDQLASMRDQLDVERRRRRDVTDRQLITDIARIGGPSYIGMRSGYHSVLPGDNIDGPGGHRFVRSTFASNPLTPPRGSSTPARQSTLYEESVLSKEHGFDQDPAGSIHSSSYGGTIRSQRDPDEASSSAAPPDEVMKPYKGI